MKKLVEAMVGRNFKMWLEIVALYAVEDTYVYSKCTQNEDSRWKVKRNTYTSEPAQIHVGKVSTMGFKCMAWKAVQLDWNIYEVFYSGEWIAKVSATYKGRVLLYTVSLTSILQCEEVKS